LGNLEKIKFRDVARRVGWASLYSFRLCAQRRTDPCLVLTYHRVTNEIKRADSLVVTSENFERQMRFVKKQFSMLSSYDVAEIINTRKPFPNKSCLITFDDGWRDNYTDAFPILRSLGMPAIVFLTTDYIGTDKRFWHDVLMDLLLSVSPQWVETVKEKKLISNVPEVEGAVVRIAGASIERRVVLINQIIEKWKGYDIQAIDSYLALIQQIVKTESPMADPAMLTWKEVEEMASAGITFGSHTKSHVILTNVDRLVIREELRGSKSLLESRLSLPVQFVAYPNGNFNDEVLAEAREAGYLGGFTCDPGMNSNSDRPFELRRRHVLNDSSVGFRGKFSSWLFAAELSGIRHDAKEYLGQRI
jgi:peptidoglycan/xylan/chitin deacetylase (PgdA/CDA1 family)